MRSVLRVWRWLFNVECSEPFCHQRRICWRWHVETATCPTCKHDVTEFDPRFADVLRASATPIVWGTQPTGTMTGTNATLRHIVMNYR